MRIPGFEDAVSRLEYGYGAVNMAHSREVIKRRLLSVVALLSYLAVGVVAIWPVAPVDAHVMLSCACSDPVQEVWFLGWVPFALLHGLDPLVSTWINYPYGVNLAENTSMPLLGMLLAPITKTYGPVASYNLLFFLAMPISAFAAFEVLRKLGISFIASLLGGLLYGFSQYEVAQNTGHLFLSFAPIPPLVFLAFYQIVINNERPKQWSVILAVLLGLELYISEEIVASLMMMLAVGMVVSLLTRRDLKQRLGSILTLSIWGGPFLLFLSLPLLYVFLAGPFRYSGSGHTIPSPYAANLLGSVLPGYSALISSKSLRSITAMFSGNGTENGSYIGIPLVVFVITTTIVSIRGRGESQLRRLVLGSSIMALVSLALSLGSKLRIGSHVTRIDLMFVALYKVPLVQDLLPARLSLYVSMFTTVVFAVGLELLDATISRRRGKRGMAAAASALVGLLSLLVLLPRWPYGSERNPTPPYFEEAHLVGTAGGTGVLTYPYPLYPNHYAMLWQAESDFRFKLIGGYIFVSVAGRPSLFPPSLGPAVVTTYFNQAFGLPGKDQALQLNNRPLLAAIREYISVNRVGTVIVGRAYHNSGAVREVLTRALGELPITSGGVYVWKIRQ